MARLFGGNASVGLSSARLLVSELLHKAGLLLGLLSLRDGRERPSLRGWASHALRTGSALRFGSRHRRVALSCAPARSRSCTLEHGFASLRGVQTDLLDMSLEVLDVRLLELSGNDRARSLLEDVVRDDLLLLVLDRRDRLSGLLVQVGVLREEEGASEKCEEGGREAGGEKKKYHVDVLEGLALELLFLALQLLESAVDVGIDPVRDVGVVDDLGDGIEFPLVVRESAARERA